MQHSYQIHSVRMFYSMCVCVLVTQSCPTLCDLTDCSPPGSSVHGILQARILECIAIPFSRGSSQPRDRTLVSHIAGRFFTIWATGTSYVLFHTVNHFFIFLIFWSTNIFNVEEFQSIFHVVHAFCVTFFKLLVKLRSWTFTLMFSSKNSITLALKGFIHFELIFRDSVKHSPISFFCMWIWRYTSFICWQHYSFPH